MRALITLMLALMLATPLHAEPAAPPAAESAVMSEGMVRKVDAANGKITLKHGPIVNLDMPAMTMVFRVQSPDLLNSVKVGDAVKFHAELVGGVYTVTAIEVAR